MWGLVLALLALLLAVLVLWTSSAALEPRPRSAASRGRPIATAGPVLASSLSGLSLDGLTVIPITRLPRLGTRIPLPFSSSTLSISADLTASELVFSHLRVGSVATRGRDVGREPIDLSAKEVDLRMTGSIGLRLTLAIGEKRAGGGRDGATARTPRTWAWKPSGRLELALSGASASALVQLVQAREATVEVEGDGRHPSAARFACVASTFLPGNISLLSLRGFFPFAFLESVVHYLRNTALVRIPTQHLVGFLVRKGVEGHIATELLGDLAHFVDKHVYTEGYSSLTRDDRDEILRRFFPLPPSPLSDDAGAATSPSPPPLEPLRFSALFHGSTTLHRLHIPQDSSPAAAADNAVAPRSNGETPVALFSRLDATGLRYTLLSSPLINQITRGPPTATFGPGTFERLAWSEARIELAPSPVQLLEGSATGPAGERELVLTVHGLDAELSLAFRLGAELRSAPSLLAGRKTLEERGVATIRIGERKGGGPGVLEERAPDEDDDGEGISIHLPLRWDKTAGRVVLSGSFDADASSTTGGASTPARHTRSLSARRAPAPRKIRLEGAFGTVAPRVKLESRLGKALGEKVVNALLDAVRTHLAALTAPLASYFLADVARQRLQRALDDVAATLQDEGGVLWSAVDPPTLAAAG
ncbi:hypothetical protein JCM10450v2_005403 [Rhodotorula kratochvilovae]